MWVEALRDLSRDRAEEAGRRTRAEAWWRDMPSRPLSQEGTGVRGKKKEKDPRRGGRKWRKEVWPVEP